MGGCPATAGAISAARTRNHRLEQVSLDLRLRGDELDGDIQAWRLTDREMTILPHWAVLHRQS